MLSLLGYACVDYRKEARTRLERDGLADLELKEIGKGSFEFKARRGSEACKGTIAINKGGSSTTAMKSMKCAPLACDAKQREKCKRLCTAGETKVCWRLGVVFARGVGIAADPKEAARWMQKACDGSHAMACNALGDRFVKGKGVSKDYIKATKLFEKACDQGSTLGCANLGLMYHSADFFGRTHPRRAAKFLKKACAKNHAGSCGRLASLYKSGSGVTKDVKKAIELYEKACSKDVAVACFNLGLMYEGGSGVAEDYPRALRAFERACKLGTGCAMIGRVKRFMAKEKAKRGK
ncbi:MAG: sel1 repeat family protein [Myxococcales bacterium]|nr:sel1 repeat family protein [Myxococcales bacterium]